MKKIIKQYKIIIAVASIFVLSYSPVLFGVPLLFIVAFFAYSYLILNFKNASKLLMYKRNFIVCLFFLLITMYLTIVIKFNNADISNISSMLYLLIFNMPISFFVILILYSKNRWNINSVFKVVTISTIIQAFLSVISYLNPNVQQFLVAQIYGADVNTVYYKLARHRMYGYSASLTFATPVLQTIIGIVVLTNDRLSSIQKSLIFLLLTFSAVINARTSVVLLILGLILIFIFNTNNNLMKIVSFFSIAILCGMFFYNGFEIKYTTNNETLKWIITGVNEITNFLSSGDNQTGYFSYVTDTERYLLPKNNKLFFGVGTRVMNENIYNYRSDIGYINDIWLGGLVYTIPLYSFFVYLLYSSYRLMKKINLKHYKLIPTYTLISLFLLNFKGYVFGYNSIIVIILLLYFSLNQSLQECENMKKSREIR